MDDVLIAPGGSSAHSASLFGLADLTLTRRPQEMWDATKHCYHHFTTQVFYVSIFQSSGRFLRDWKNVPCESKSVGGVRSSEPVGTSMFHFPE